MTSTKDADKERLAAEASERIKTGQHWLDWMFIADGLVVGRKQAMRAAKTNEPIGANYAKALAAWKKGRPWAELDKATTAHLFWAAENRSAIEKWRETLTEGERAKINHPTTMKRRFKAKTKVPEPKEGKVKPGKVQQLTNENDRLKAELDQRAEDGVQVPKGSKLDDILEAILAALSPTAVRRLGNALLARGDAAQPEAKSKRARNKKRAMRAKVREDEMGLPPARVESSDAPAGAE